jgi:hypothetical protein
MKFSYKIELGRSEKATREWIIEQNNWYSITDEVLKGSLCLSVGNDEYLANKVPLLELAENYLVLFNHVLLFAGNTCHFSYPDSAIYISAERLYGKIKLTVGKSAYDRTYTLGVDEFSEGIGNFIYSISGVMFEKFPEIIESKSCNKPPSMHSTIGELLNIMKRR